jgi:hypothetical protein
VNQYILLVPAVFPARFACIPSPQKKQQPPSLLFHRRFFRKKLANALFAAFLVGDRAARLACRLTGRLAFAAAFDVIKRCFLNGLDMFHDDCSVSTIFSSTRRYRRKFIV